MNMANLLGELGGGENLQIDLKNEVIKGLCCVHEGGETPMENYCLLPTAERLSLQKFCGARPNRKLVHLQLSLRLCLLVLFLQKSLLF